MVKLKSELFLPRHFQADLIGNGLQISMAQLMIQQAFMNLFTQHLKHPKQAKALTEDSEIKYAVSAIKGVNDDTYHNDTSSWHWGSGYYVPRSLTVFICDLTEFSQLWSSILSILQMRKWRPGKSNMTMVAQLYLIKVHPNLGPPNSKKAFSLVLHVKLDTTNL